MPSLLKGIAGYTFQPLIRLSRISGIEGWNTTLKWITGVTQMTQIFHITIFPHYVPTMQK